MGAERRNWANDRTKGIEKTVTSRKRRKVVKVKGGSRTMTFISLNLVPGLSYIPLLDGYCGLYIFSDFSFIFDFAGKILFE